MGTDVSFQLFDPRLVTEQLLPALARGDAPPPSRFDTLPTAKDTWEAARAALAKSKSAATLKTISDLIVSWSSASWDGTSTRNLGLTIEPLRMERELQGAPHAGLDLITPLVARVGLRRVRADDPAIARAAIRPDDGGIRQWYVDAPYRYRGRVAPILSVFRAARRHQLGVLEVSDGQFHGGNGGADLAWPGLARFGLDGAALTPSEWDAVIARAADYGRGDREDVLDRVAEVDDEGVLGRVLAAFGWTREEMLERRALLGLADPRAAQDALANTLAQTHLVVAGVGVCEVGAITTVTLAGRDMTMLELRHPTRGKIRLPIKRDLPPEELARFFRPLATRAQAETFLATFRPDPGWLGDMPSNRRHDAVQELSKRGTLQDLGALVAYYRANVPKGFIELRIARQTADSLSEELAHALGRDVQTVRAEIAPEIA